MIYLLGYQSLLEVQSGCLLTDRASFIPDLFWIRAIKY